LCFVHNGDINRKRKQTVDYATYGVPSAERLLVVKGDTLMALQFVNLRTHAYKKRNNKYKNANG
jgi:hypothetical protein